MVVAAFPLAKIGLLFLKQLSKPVANMIKNEAKKHPYVRKYVIIPTGKAFRWLESTTIDRVKGSKDLEPPTEDELIELGSNAIGEIIFFGLLSIILLAEISRQGDKKAEIQKNKDNEMINLVEVVTGLMDDMENLKKSVKKIQEDIEVAFDVIELEDQQHTVVHDHNFLDIIGTKQKFGKSKRSESWDDASPSS